MPSRALTSGRAHKKEETNDMRQPVGNEKILEGEKLLCILVANMFFVVFFVIYLINLSLDALLTHGKLLSCDIMMEKKSFKCAFK